MKIVLEIWGIVKKYLLDIWGIFLGAWYIIKLDSISKFNQILLTVYIIMLIRYKLQEKRGHKPKENKLSKVFKKLVGRNQSIRYLSVGDNAEIQVESIINLSEKIRKEGPEDAMKIWRIIKSLLSLLRANKITLGGNATVLTIYYFLVEELLTEYGYTFTNQPTNFYLWLGGYTILVLIALLATYGKGPETIGKFIARISQKKLTGIVDSLVGLSIKSNSQLVKEKLEKAYELLDIVTPFIREADVETIKASLDNVRDKWEEYNALQIMREEDERAKARLRAQAILSKPKPVEAPENGYVIKK